MRVTLYHLYFTKKIEEDSVNLFSLGLFVLFLLASY